MIKFNCQKNKCGLLLIRLGKTANLEHYQKVVSSYSWFFAFSKKGVMNRCIESYKF